MKNCHICGKETCGIFAWGIGDMVLCSKECLSKFLSLLHERKAK